jgi:hypothetical protein
VGKGNKNYQLGTAVFFFLSFRDSVVSAVRVFVKVRYGM